MAAARIRAIIRSMADSTHAIVKPTFSIASILAIIAALFSFHFGAALGFILAVLAIALGVIGLVLALLPGTRGGMMSVISIVAGAIGIIAAILKLIGNVLG
jgi:hypothetical protein